MADDFRARVRDDFARQGFMRLLGAEITRVEAGECDIALATRPDFTQQHGYVHAGVTTALADTAAGYAAFTLMPPGSSVLTVEFKQNLMNPAKGERLVARGKVEKSGRTLTVVRADVVAVSGGEETAVATMLATMICLRKD